MRICIKPSKTPITVCVAPSYAAIACPIKAVFRIDPQEPAIVEPNICHGCGDCVGKCIAKAVTLKEN